MARLPKLNECSLWLLYHMADRHAKGLGLCRTNPVPSDAPLGVGMAHLRGLERRCWATERNGLFYLTEAGVAAAAAYRASGIPCPVNTTGL